MSDFNFIYLFFPKDYDYDYDYDYDRYDDDYYDRWYDNHPERGWERWDEFDQRQQPHDALPRDNSECSVCCGEFFVPHTKPPAFDETFRFVLCEQLISKLVFETKP